MFIPNTRIEVINSSFPRGRVRVGLFDFDGTLSLIREGWPEIMIPMMVRHLAKTPTTETPAELTSRVEEFVMRLNGKQTIYQMIQLADEIRKRGGTPLDPLDYKHEYHDLLWKRIEGRVAALDQKSIDSETLTVPGSLPLLQRLTGAKLPLYLASGTDRVYVENEIRALGLASFFGAHIYGAIDDYKNFSKKMIIEKVVSELALQPGELVGFGDGYVEIEEVKKVGGIAVGVASDEQNRTAINEWKRNRLIQAGADIIVPDYRDLDALLKLLEIEKT
ncbi:MAG: HAD family hydrolase [Planctomycetes bacterium]|nr:HAD family hydrolase [Planctomycetota bacterium]